MADPKEIAKKDGAHKTNRIAVERVDFLADGYEIEALADEEIGTTGRLKVLRVRPSDQYSDAARLLGRWDDGPAQQLDFNLVDRQDNQIGKLPYGHHPRRIESADEKRLYKVKIGRNEKNIVFEGIVSVAIGFRARLGGGTIRVG